ncbi:MAG: amidohydrolase [Anaerolineaceae bacterium]|nr:amidohydrolase [Anaerolineaceae bacterium]
MKTKQDIINWLDENKKNFTDISDQIWEFAEIAYKEFKSSKLQADFLEEQGFKITWDIYGINTAFVAEWSSGSGGPIIGFVGEYDALANLSQKIQPTQETFEEGAAGHACGHNLLGTAPMASASSIRYWLEASGKPGTVRYYGCPAEEVLSGKTFMAKAGVFDDLDVAFNFHPGDVTMASKGSSVGLNDIKFRFYGKSAHAGGSPHLGRSALDAVELMNVGVNYLREHVTDKVRIHYAITKGGDAPNIVPAEAEVWYFIRAQHPDELEEVTNRIRKVAQGAATMTETTVEEHFQGACSSMLSNHYMADLQYEAMQLLGPIEFDQSEKDFARQLVAAYPDEFFEKSFERTKENLPEELTAELDALEYRELIPHNLPSIDEDEVMTGSTDVGDVSRITPLCFLSTACAPIGVPAHSWGFTATSGSTIGHKGMLHAAKIMALAAMDCYTDPKHIQNARQEFEAAITKQPYKNPIPDHVKPPVFENPERP